MAPSKRQTKEHSSRSVALINILQLSETCRYQVLFAFFAQTEQCALPRTHSAITRKEQHRHRRTLPARICVSFSDLTFPTPRTADRFHNTASLIVYRGCVVRCLLFLGASHFTLGLYCPFALFPSSFSHCHYLCIHADGRS